MDSDDDLDCLVPNQRNTTRENSESEENGDSYNSEASYNSFMDVSEEDEDHEDHEDLEEDRLPDLIREDEGPEPRECWICFVPETENPVAQWVTPCRCAGSLGHVHQDCVKRWVEEKQNGNIDLDVICPQCETKYKFVFPTKNSLLQILNFADKLVATSVQLAFVGGAIGAIYIVCTFYTRQVFKAMVDENFGLRSLDGQCLTLEPYYSQVIAPFQQVSRRFRIFFRVFSLSSLQSMATMAASQQEREDIEGLIILMDAINDFWLRQIRKFTRFFTSFYTPYFILNMRQTKWDEMILRRIDDYEGVKTRYSAVLGVKPARVYIGGLAMPFISRIVGDYVFHKESNVYKRFLFGAATYLSVKGVITLVRKYKFRRWLRERKVKDFEENDNADNQNGNRSLQIELNGENWLDFQF